jgi:hypothetical protein
MLCAAAALAACLLAACSGLAPSAGGGCSSGYQCEIRGYDRAGG